MQQVNDLVPQQVLRTRNTVLLWQGSQRQTSNIWCYILALITSSLLFPIVALVGAASLAASQPYIVFAPFNSLVWLVWQSVVTAMHYCQLTGQRLRDTSGVLNRATEALDLCRVKDIVASRPNLYRFFGRGTIVMPTSDKSTSTIALKCISDPLRVADMVREHVERCRVNKGVREID